MGDQLYRGKVDELYGEQKPTFIYRGIAQFGRALPSKKHGKGHRFDS